MGVVPIVNSLGFTNADSVQSYLENKAQNELQLWQRSVDPWTGSSCDFELVEGLELMENVQSDADPMFVRWYNDFYMLHVFGYRIFACIIILLPIVCITRAVLKGPQLDGSSPLGQFYCLYIVFCVLPIFVDCILELVAYISLDQHYDRDLTASMNRTIESLEGCGGPNFEQAIQFITGQRVVYERPSGQIVSLILGFILLVDLLAFGVIFMIMALKHE